MILGVPILKHFRVFLAKVGSIWQEWYKYRIAFAHFWHTDGNV